MKVVIVSGGIGDRNVRRDTDSENNLETIELSLLRVSEEESGIDVEEWISLISECFQVF